MGAEPYWYFEEYDGDVEAALKALREREFRTGRYNPVVPFPESPPGPNSPSPGAQHSSIGDVMSNASEEGTRSILDLDHVSEFPDFCAVAPLPESLLRELYSTIRPTREMVERNMDFLESVERGQGVYIILYKESQPSEILFAGYSFD